MKIRCPSCEKLFEMEHVERGRRVRCQCSKEFLLDDSTVLADYSSIDEPPPAKIGPCEIERLIGKGGMGKVYKGRHPALGIPVAVKTILPEYSSDRSFKVRFIQSAKICAQVDHPNIVRIYDCGEEDGCVYLVLEYIGGGSVQRMIERHGPLPFDKICEIASAVCQGLVEAGRHGIVHRDIKPENIMRSRDGEYKLSDLGLAKQRSEDSRKLDPSLTMAFVSLGTPQYMPPEQAIDAKSCDARADIYSLGVSLYEMATGRLPFVSSDPAELKKMHLDLEPEPPSKFREELPPDLEKIILKCMKKKMEERYQTPEELLADFAALKDGSPLPSFQEERKEPAAPEEAEAGRTEKKSSSSRIFWLGAGLIALLFAAWELFDLSEPSPKRGGQAQIQRTPQAQAGRPEEAGKPALETQSPSVKESVSTRRMELWKYACSFADKALKDGDSFDAAISNLKAFVEDEEAKELAQEAARRVAELEAAKAQALNKLMGELAAKAASFAKSRESARAADIYESYAGKLALESEALRLEAAKPLREAAKVEEERKKEEEASSEARRDSLLSACADLLLQERRQSAFELASSEEARRLCPELAPALTELAALPLKIIASFRPQAGSQRYIHVNGERIFVTVLRVEDGAVYVEETVNKAKLVRKFDAGELALREKAGRMLGCKPELKALYLGLESLRADDADEAIRYFKNAGALGAALAARLEKALERKDGSVGEEDSSDGVQRPGPKAAVSGKELRARLTPSKTADGLNAELTKANPGYYGTAQIWLLKDDGVGIDMTGLKISNIDSLKGQPVKTLVANACPIADLKPLKGAPLENLQIAGTKVSDLKPLAGMQLKTFAFSPNAISDKEDLKIVRDMKSLESIGVPDNGSIKFMRAEAFWDSFDSKAWKR